MSGWVGLSASSAKSCVPPLVVWQHSMQQCVSVKAQYAIMQGNTGLLSRLNGAERSHLLSYQVCQLLDSLSAVTAEGRPTL